MPRRGGMTRDSQPGYIARESEYRRAMEATINTRLRERGNGGITREAAGRGRFSAWNLRTKRAGKAQHRVARGELRSHRLTHGAHGRAGSGGEDGSRFSYRKLWP